jgi:hypothetical protein
MIKIRSTTQLAAAVLASGCFALALGARAEPGQHSMEVIATGSAAACKSARQSAWFERQRQLTDGNPNQSLEIATPRECATMQGANAAADAAPGKQLSVSATTPQQGTRPIYEGVTLGGQ